MVNVHASVKFIANFALSHMPNKLRERVKFYSTFDEIDVIERKYLPKEYGGDVELKEMTGNFCKCYTTFHQLKLFSSSDSLKKTLAAKKEFFLNYNNMKVNRNLYPASVMNCVVETLKTPLNSQDLFEKTSNCRDEELSGLQGSFRKLEID